VAESLHLNPPRRLPSTAYDKVWGSPDTEPWFRNQEHRDIGEIWFSASDSVPLLVKFLFTSGNLSVQVHPDDEYAGRHHNSRGKTEMWHILRAKPDAKIALGLREKVTRDRLREAASSGEIMDLLNWTPARAGDTFFIPAGTVHAIGGGLALCEVQQLSDITYRLYDYGRPRELHLEHGTAVSHLEPRGCAVRSKIVGPRRELLVECPYFRSERLTVTGSWRSDPAARATIYIALEGEGFLADQPFHAGEAWEACAGSEPFEIASQQATFMIAAA
jgi:mannose-6-phosphate isomerase